MSTTPISDITPLEPDYIPNEFIDRENPETALSNLLGEDSSRNIHFQGPRGTGKTHLTKSILKELSSDINTCYIDSRRADTQYKALKQTYRSLTGQQVNSGHHTSDLQRKIKERTGAIPTIIVIDEIDFLLLNDGESLLYYLSRLDSNAQTSIITISNHITELQNQIEERTYSSLQPYPIQLEPYTGEETFQILLQRAQQALKPQTLQRDALTYVASITHNTRLAIQWLKTAATETDTLITENTVQETREEAHKRYTAHLLDQHTPHHKLLYQAITELDNEKEAIQAGDVYQRYQELAQSYDEERLSNRRISDFLKHLELLNLIKAEYHYGGKKGKTREIKIQSPFKSTERAN